ncbi:hypothetical protein K457DRAFT_13457 [Linnemannia elongata AG-77]|uniref:Uncharacterized protein n=1 Tax=Linnemannia elongata AG-77 TaxID=1314771 RepID=A0A197KEE7_9FUNG|nr:hypothetical protein K457DRAFT_13457 [Linnemannia elongata AG-77]
METTVEMLSSSTATLGDERRFSSSSASDNTYSTMMNQELTPQTITITTTTTTTTTTTAITPTVPANNYDLCLTHQKTVTDADVADKEEEEEMQRLEFLRDVEDDVEDDDDVQISTRSSLAYPIQSPLNRSLSSAQIGDHAVGVPVEFQSDERSESENVGEGDDGGDEGCLGERLERTVHFQRMIDEDDEQEGGRGGGETVGGLAPGTETVEIQKDLATKQDCIFDYPDPRASNSNDDQIDHGDIIAPHTPFLPIFSPITLRPQRLCKVPVVGEYIDPNCPPTPPPIRPPPLLLPPTPPRSSVGSGSSSSDDPSTAAAVPVPVNTDDVNVNVNVMVVHDHNSRQKEEMNGEESLDMTDSIAQEVSPFHPLDRPPPSPQQQQQKQQQPDRIRWRLSTNYPPTRRRGERRTVTASGTLATSTSGATIYGDTTDSSSLRSSMIAPTTFVMIDTNGNQILTDPYTSSVTPPLPSPLSAAIMGGGGGGGGGGGSTSGNGKALLTPVPLWLTTAIPRYHFTGNSNSSNINNGNNSSSSPSSGVINPTTDPQVAAHIAEALRMYGIPSLHQPTTVHPFQRFSMTPSTPSRSTSLGTSATGGDGYEPPRGSTFPRLMHRSPSRSSSSTTSSSPSRIVRVWAALTGRGVTSTTNTTITTNTTNGSSRATTMVASPSTTHSRFSQLVQPSSSSSASSATLQYEQLPFVQQPRRPTIVLPSPLTRASVVLGSGSTASSSAVATSFSVTGGGGNCDGGGNIGDGNGDGGDEGDEEGNDDGAGEQQLQQQTRSILQNADPDDKDLAAAGEPSAFQTFLKVFMCGC